ncbi:MAG: serine hydrolase [Lysobacteraceae bacterium]
MNGKLAFAPLLLALVSAFAVADVPSEDATKARLDRQFDQAMQRYQLPGLALGVVRDGKVIYLRTGGERRIGSGEAIGPDTLFKIASNGKAMTAAALARLVDAGKLDWNDPVKRHLPAFRMNDPWVEAQFTARDMLIHNSGLPLGAGDLMLWPEPNDFSREHIIASLAHLKPSTSFRSAYAYDNLMYLVAGEVGAAIAGVPYETLVKREVFEPLGLSRCVVGAFERDAVGDIAAPHLRTDKGFAVASADPPQVAPITSAAAGGIRCSVRDMTTWIANWLDPQRTPNWLSADQRRAAFTGWMPMPIGARQAAWDASHFNAYGHGWRISDTHGQFRVAHTGTLEGMLSAVTMLPDRNLGYVLLLNSNADDARIALNQAVLMQFIAPDGQGHDFNDYADRLDAEHAASGAEEARQAAAKRDPLPLSKVAKAVPGVYVDPWFGEISLCPKEGNLRWRSHRSPVLDGLVKQVEGRWLIEWDERSLYADAWLDVSADGKPINDGNKTTGSPTMAISVVDPDTDFSYDFHDLSPVRTRDCD